MARRDDETPTVGLPPRLPLPESDGGESDPELVFGLPRGAVVGRYVVLERVGSGGMGVVYAAYDPELDRRVALKILRADVGQNPVRARARLLREAQAMARLQHPNVVAVHDVGAIGHQVFLAMEFIAGRDLEAYLAERTRPWREVLAAFLAAGDGLAAAHAAGLVHRDFKPANVLVGDDGRVRVVDFGLARAAHDVERGGEETSVSGVSASSALRTPLTHHGTVIGTPGYMAPEQEAGETVDERSDQYSFCVALRQALQGSGPIPRWIEEVLSCGLSREPERRWPSLAALLDALRADPEARRRRRLLTVAAAAGMAALLVLPVVWQRRQSRVCRGAEQRLVGVWDGDGKTAIRQAFLATAAPFAPAAWSSVEGAVDAYARGWADQRTSACEATRISGEQSEELLDLRVSCLDRRLASLRALTDVFRDADERVVERAVRAAGALPPLAACADGEALRAVVRPPEDAALAARVTAARAQTARAKALTDTGKYQEALPVAEAALAEARDLAYAPLLAEAHFELAVARDALGRSEEAAASFEESLLAALAGRDDPAAVDAAANLMIVVGYDLARAEEGERWGRQARALLERTGNDPNLAGLVHTLSGMLAVGRGDYERAIAEQREALRLREQVFGLEHANVGRTLTNLSAALLSAGRAAEAIPVLERSLSIKEATLGADHPDVPSTLGNLAFALSDVGRTAEAVTLAERSLAIRRRLLGDEHPDVALEWGNLAADYQTLGRLDEARAAATRALAIYEKNPGPDHPSTASVLDTLGGIELERGDLAAAEAAHRRALAIKEKALGASHPELGFSLTGLGKALREANRLPAALALLRGAVAIRSQPDVGAAYLAESRYELGKTLWLSGDRREGQRLAREALAALTEAGTHPRLRAEMEAWLAAR